MAHSSIAHMRRTALRAGSSQNTRLGYIVLTARNRQQAVAQDSSLRQTRRNGRLPSTIEVLCAPDPPGGNSEGGGARLLALPALAQGMTGKGQPCSDARVSAVRAGGRRQAVSSKGTRAPAESRLA